MVPRVMNIDECPKIVGIDHFGIFNPDDEIEPHGVFLERLFERPALTCTQGVGITIWSLLYEDCGSKASMKLPTDTALCPSDLSRPSDFSLCNCVATAASRACMTRSTATSSPRRPRSMQCKSECFARWRTGVPELSLISCHAAFGQEEFRSSKGLRNPAVTARHSRM
jgi:hypothetical protein